MDDHVDKKFACYAKNDRKKGENWTRLQFVFQACDHCEMFPTGVQVSDKLNVLLLCLIQPLTFLQVTYRAFAANSVVDIIQDATAFCGLREEGVEVVSYPEEDKTNGTPAGMYILIGKFDNSNSIKPMAFEDGGRESLDRVTKYVIIFISLLFIS